MRDEGGEGAREEERREKIMTLCLCLAFKARGGGQMENQDAAPPAPAASCTSLIYRKDCFSH